METGVLMAPHPGRTKDGRKPGPQSPYGGLDPQTPYGGLDPTLDPQTSVGGGGPEEVEQAFPIYATLPASCLVQEIPLCPSNEKWAGEQHRKPS
ncbi:unnamed protein product [Gadus morhua 'NCC']